MSFQLKKNAIAVLSLFLVGCSHSQSIALFGPKVSVFNEPVTQNSLASVHVNTPDPLHQLNPHGQRLHISWRIPRSYQKTHLRGVLKVQFKVPKQIEIPFQITKHLGHFTYQVINEDYFEQKGILSYQVQIFENNREIAHFQNKMWAKLVDLNPK
ncbi:MAG: hypothetical protein S4CHLAM7_02450 [Chlamydiae bacterium]|nr:hypothetical protein [Chlamydiota bacterium]